MTNVYVPGLIAFTSFPCESFSVMLKTSFFPTSPINLGCDIAPAVATTVSAAAAARTATTDMKRNIMAPPRGITEQPSYAEEPQAVFSKREGYVTLKLPFMIAACGSQ